jgi:NAD(P)-dependent dehydrogenase (short-subunit alcohol dehydrogenase family)
MDYEAQRRKAIMSREVGKRFDLSGKVTVITGGLGILGRRFCRGICEGGGDLAILDFKKDEDGFVTTLRSDYGTRVRSIQCNVSAPESVADATKEVMGEFGQVDVLFNNAASKSSDLDAFFASFEEYSLEEWRKVMSVNLDGVFLMAQAFGNEMVKAGRGGSIIQTASIYGHVAPDQRIYEGSEYEGRAINTPAVYSASKAGVIGLTKYLASYWGDKDIRVNTLTPGGVESGQNEEFKKRYSARTPLGRMADADDMVGAAVYLASDASRYVTGQNIIVDGGLSCW